jgi:predicted permease
MVGLQPWFNAMLDADTRREGFPRATAEQRRAFLASRLDVLPAARGVSDVRGILQRPLWVLFGGTVILLLSAALNVASLLLAKGATRARELTTRMALGASRSRIAGQLLVETMLLTTAGGVLGLLIAPWVSRVLLSFLSRDLQLGSRPDLRVFPFAFLVSLVTGLCCGLAPSLQAGRTSLISSIKTQSGVAAGAAVRLRKSIGVAQMAFTLVLLIGAGLFVQTLARLKARDVGFASSSLVMFYLEPDAIGYSESDAPRVMRDVLQRLQSVAVVERAAVANSQILGGGSPRRTLTIESDRRVVPERSIPIMRVGPGFFSTLGATVLAGRDFTEDDTRDLQMTGFRSVVVNESFARQYFGGRSPVGHRVGVGNRPDTKTTIEIVGMIKDFRFRTMRDDQEPEHVFFPFAPTGPLAGNGTFYVRVRGEPENAFSSIRAAVAEVDARLPLVTLTTVDGRIDGALRSERMLAALSTGFGTIAVLLSVIGLYGVMSFTVARRTQEMPSAGARRHSVRRGVARHSGCDGLDRRRNRYRASDCVGPQASRRSTALRRSCIRRTNRCAGDRVAGVRSMLRGDAARVACGFSESDRRAAVRMTGALNGSRDRTAAAVRCSCSR